jgi:thiol:disulfide interchange protein
MTRWLLSFLFSCRLALLLLLATLAHAEEFLDPALAFQPSARAVDGQHIEVRFAIAKGYYLYRDKFRFAAEPATIALGAPALPPGKEKRDDTFGTGRGLLSRPHRRPAGRAQQLGTAAADPESHLTGLRRRRHLLSAAAAEAQSATAGPGDGADHRGAGGPGCGR